MHFLPILSTLRRHRTAAILIVLEIALTCAIVCNAVFLIRERLARMDRPSGFVEDEIVRIRTAGIGTRVDPGAMEEKDFAALRALPGVKAATFSNMVPYSGSSWNSGVSTKPHDSTSTTAAATYFGSKGFIATTGITLIAGRDFTDDDFIDYDQLSNSKKKVAAVIISRALAERMFPGASPLGKPLYIWGDDPQIVVGVVDRLARPNDVGGPEQEGFTVLMPISAPYLPGGSYILRVDPARAHDVLNAADKALDANDPNRIITDHQTLAEVRGEHFKQDRSMAYLLTGVSIALLVITALGVVGLASFWVQYRTRQIGVRRALGATRGDILRYFQLENFILATAGIIIGMGMAYGINMWLMDKYQVARLPAEFLPIGAALLWLLGQVAVLGPALRAAAIPPAIATRSV